MSTDHLISNVSFTKWKSMLSPTRTAAWSNLNLWNKVEFTHFTVMHWGRGQLDGSDGWFLYSFSNSLPLHGITSREMYTPCAAKCLVVTLFFVWKSPPVPHHLLQHIKPLREMLLPPEKHLLQALPWWNNGVICLMFEGAQTRLKGRDGYNENVFSPDIVPREHP